MFSTYLRLNLPVSASGFDVVRATRRTLTKRFRTLRHWRTERHAIYRAMLRHHASARALYRNVMRGA